MDCLLIGFQMKIMRRQRGIKVILGLWVSISETTNEQKDFHTC